MLGEIGGGRLEGADMEPILAGRDLRKFVGLTLVFGPADFPIHAGESCIFGGGEEVPPVLTKS